MADRKDNKATKKCGATKKTAIKIESRSFCCRVVEKSAKTHAKKVEGTGPRNKYK